jgi:hypothetical protein
MCFLPGCLVDRFSSALSLPPLPPSTSLSAWSAPSSFRDRHFDTRRSLISQRAGDAAFPAPIHRVAAERARAGVSILFSSVWINVLTLVGPLCWREVHTSADAAPVGDRLVGIPPSLLRRRGGWLSRWPQGVRRVSARTYGGVTTTHANSSTCSTARASSPRGKAHAVMYEETETLLEVRRRNMMVRASRPALPILLLLMLSLLLVCTSATRLPLSNHPSSLPHPSLPPHSCSCLFASYPFSSVLTESPRTNPVSL